MIPKIMGTTLQVRELGIEASHKTDLINTLSSLSGHRVLVVGDVGLDEYVLGDVRRISPEAPVPVLEVSEEDKRLGLAGNVAQNILSLGGEPRLVGVIGKDFGGDALRDLFYQNKISTDYLVVDPHRPTTRKTRVMAKHHHLVRVDYELRRHLTPEVERSLIAQFQKSIDDCSVVVLEDYAKGVLSEACLAQLISISHKHKKKILLDPNRGTPCSYYKGVDLLKPNYEEGVTLSGLDFDDLRDHPDKVTRVCQALQEKTGASEIVLTQGREGMTIFTGGKVTHVPTYARQVFDVTGAGDTVIAALALGVAAGFGLEKSCILANFAAGVVVGKVGCVPCGIPELKKYILEH